MYTHHPIALLKTTTGLEFIIVPAPRFLGCTVDAAGKPTALKYPDHSYWSKTGYKTYPDLKGLNCEDVQRYKPDFILYRLGDGTLLQADKDAIESAGKGSNSATSDGRDCLTHLVKDLEIVSMPEVCEPELDFSVAPVAPVASVYRPQRRNIPRLPRAIQLVTL
jgi:hypothetical protein